MTLREKLGSIQMQMKAPKGRRNSFGKYNYRSCEDILQAFKPYEEMYKVSLVIRDDIVQVADRVYVKATATLLDTESDDTLFTSAYAREAETKKGMDDSQITGTASSYARKYALNGLFLLDDTKDADTDEYHKQTQGETVTKDMVKTLEATIPEHGGTVEAVCKYYKVGGLSDLTVEQFKDCMNRMEGK